MGESISASEDLGAPPPIDFCCSWLIEDNRGHIEQAFTGVSSSIEALVDGQIRKARDKGLTVTVSYTLGMTKSI